MFEINFCKEYLVHIYVYSIFFYDRLTEHVLDNFTVSQGWSINNIIIGV